MATCKTCRTELVRTASGWVCPAGHGRIVSPRDVPKVLRPRLDLLVATQIELPRFGPASYTIAGLEGTFHKAIRFTGFRGEAEWYEPGSDGKKAVPENLVIARYKGKVVRFVRTKEKQGDDSHATYRQKTCNDQR